MSVILAMGTANPAYTVPQNTILGFMHHAYANDVASRKLNVLFNSSGIQSRSSAVPDFDSSYHENSFFSGDLQPGIENRLMKFREGAVPLAMAAISKAVSNAGSRFRLNQITHVITVTCTGLHSPGLDSMLMKELELAPDIFHTSFNFLGCNAAFPAVHFADKIAGTHDKACVLVVCVELCTLHFQPKNNHDNLLSNTIFGDGAAALIITAENDTRFPVRPCLHIKSFYSCLFDEGKSLMGWNITPLNFEMILDTAVPAFISSHLYEYLTRMEARFGLNRVDVARWAIHPGGRKILDHIKEFLQVSLTESYEVLRKYGNMSSPTVLFVIEETLKSDLQTGSSVIALGFGPGISIDAMHLYYA